MVDKVRNHDRVRWTVVLVVVCILCGHSRAQCSSTAEEKKETPQFLCSFEIILEPADDCSAQITERMIFPHLINGDIEREIPSPDKDMISESASWQYDNDENKSIDFEQDARGDGVHYTVFTENSSSQVGIILKYKVANYVMNHTRRCGLPEEPDASGEAIIRWRSPESWNFDYTYRRLVVSVVVNGSSEKFYEESDISEVVEPFKILKGFECPKEFLCFPKKKSTFRLDIVFPVAIAVIIIVIGIVFFVRRKSYRKYLEMEQTGESLDPESRRT